MSARAYKEKRACNSLYIYPVYSSDFISEAGYTMPVVGKSSIPPTRNVWVECLTVYDVIMKFDDCENSMPSSLYKPLMSVTVLFLSMHILIQNRSISTLLLLS